MELLTEGYCACSEGHHKINGMIMSRLPLGLRGQSFFTLLLYLASTSPEAVCVLMLCRPQALP